MTEIESLMEENADRALWCVHVLGPDDLYAAENHQAAVAHANELNTAIFKRMAATKEPNDILCFAYAAPWPHTKESHAEDLKKDISNC